MSEAEQIAEWVREHKKTPTDDKIDEILGEEEEEEEGKATIFPVNWNTDNKTKLGGTLYWIEGEEDWKQDIEGQDFDKGTSIVIGGGWSNTTSSKIEGHVDLTLTKPDGTEVELDATQNQDKEADPGDGWSVRFEKVTLDQVGNYTLDFDINGTVKEEEGGGGGGGGEEPEEPEEEEPHEFDKCGEKVHEDTLEDCKDYLSKDEVYQIKYWPCGGDCLIKCD